VRYRSNDGNKSKVSDEVTRRMSVVHDVNTNIIPFEEYIWCLIDDITSETLMQDNKFDAQYEVLHIS
jgi:hypothetical protein